MSVIINIPSMDSLKPEYNKIRAIQALYAAVKQITEGGGGGGGTSFSDLGFNSFDSSTSYSKGDVVEKDGTLYEFTTSHTGDWDASDVQETSVEALIEGSEQPTNIEVITESISTLSCEAGKLYNISSAVGTLAITLPTITELKAKTVVLYFMTSSSPSVTISGGNNVDVYYYDNYELEASTTYEVSCLWNGGAWVIGAAKINTGS